MTVPTNTAPGYHAASPARGTAELCVVAELSDDARALVAATGAPPQRAFVAQLSEKGLHTDAVRFIAHALPRREAVWWAWVCARNAAGDAPAPPIKAALDATERWIVQPSEDHRRAAFQFAEAADLGTAAGSAALAAFLSGGSLAPATAAAVPPGEFMTAKAVTGAVILAAVAKEPATAGARFNEFIRLGIEVAERTKLWPAA